MVGSAIATAGRLLWRMLERRGIDPAPLHKSAGLDPASLDNPLVRYPEKEARRAWTLAMEMVDDPSFGLEIAQVWKPGDFHALGCAFLASNTLRDALNRLVRYNAVVRDVITYSLTEQDDLASLAYSSVDAKNDEPAILEDTRWALVLDACREIYGAHLDPVEVTFWHAAPDSNLDEFVEFFRCRLQFGEPVARMVFPSEVLDRPLTGANRELALANDRILGDYLVRLQRDDIVSRTKSAISEHLSSGKISSAVVASALRISPRSLQRKLAAANTTYSEVLYLVRQELAGSYLDDRSLTLAEISYLLGFSSQAAFSRAFRRWTGHTPQESRIGA
jgi:AraC-like DNA-binding protein